MILFTQKIIPRNKDKKQKSFNVDDTNGNVDDDTDHNANVDNGDADDNGNFTTDSSSGLFFIQQNSESNSLFESNSYPKVTLIFLPSYTVLNPESDGSPKSNGSPKLQSFP